MSKTKLLSCIGVLSALLAAGAALLSEYRLALVFVAIAIVGNLLVSVVTHEYVVKTFNKNTNTLAGQISENRSVAKSIRAALKTVGQDIQKVKKDVVRLEGSVKSNSQTLGQLENQLAVSTVNGGDLASTKNAATSKEPAKKLFPKISLLGRPLRDFVYAWLPLSRKRQGEGITQDPEMEEKTAEAVKIDREASRTRDGDIRSSADAKPVMRNQNPKTQAKDTSDAQRLKIYEQLLGREDSFEATEQRFGALKGKSKKPRIILVTSNGAGLGHLTRMAAIDRELEATTLIYTMSSAYHRLGKKADEIVYFPSHRDIGMNGKLWNGLMMAHFDAVVRGFKPDAIVFDGTYVYRGVAGVAKKRKLPLIWVQRGCWKPEVDARSKQRRNPEKFVTDVIIPGDYGCAEDVDMGKSIIPTKVAPIVLCNETDLLSRTEARRFLDLPEDKKLFLVQLGAGVINDISNIKLKVVESVRSLGDDWEPVLVRNPLANHDELPDVLSVQAYPLAKYYRAFDAGAFAAGYNTVQESVQFGLPGLFIPNIETKTDDQVRRADEIQKSGLGRSAKTASEIEAAVKELSSDSVRSQMVAKMSRARDTSGSRAAAQHIMSHAREHQI